MTEAGQFPQFAKAYSKEAREIRKGLPEAIRAALVDIEDELAEDPKKHSHRTVQLAEDLFIYRHPSPQVELTCKIDRERQVLYILHVVAPSLEVAKPVFISYSHRDEAWLNELRKYLKPLEKRESIKIWDDREIKAGQDWREEIRGSLTSAKAAVLLISQDFLASDFINDEELPQLLAAAESRGVSIFWIAVSSSTVEDTEIAKFQAVNDPANPLDALPPGEQKKQLLHIYRRIKEVVES